MFISALNVENLRNLAQVEIQPHPKLNLFSGDNGAGKTSILESIVVLSRGRSFRTPKSAELIGADCKLFRVFAEIIFGDHTKQRLGLERSNKQWRARKDGEGVHRLSDLSRSLPVVVVEPNSHLLVSGPPEVRRRLLDWGTFHVKQDFLDTWRNYSRILKQRNAAIRNNQPDLLDGLDHVLCPLGQRLGEMRESHCDELNKRVQAVLDELDSGVKGINLSYQRGWKEERLDEALLKSREGDFLYGSTRFGPHRSDFALMYGVSHARARLSRGEQKLIATALLLTQSELLAECGEKPLLLLDDLASEFDEGHYKSVLEKATSSSSQVWVTGTRMEAFGHEHKLFHVEHGSVQEML